MRIITQAIRVIDYENNKVLPRDIMPKFGEYIEQLISYINGNTSIREYKTQSVGGEVISSIEKKEELLQKLQKLPEEQHFDQQFHPSLSVIKRKMKKTYDVYSGIQIKVTSAVEDLGDVIEAYQANDGKRYLKIRIDNDVTFRTFERKAES